MAVFLLVANSGMAEMTNQLTRIQRGDRVKATLAVTVADDQHGTERTYTTPIEGRCFGIAYNGRVWIWVYDSMDRKYYPYLADAERTQFVERDWTSPYMENLKTKFLPAWAGRLAL